MSPAHWDNEEAREARVKLWRDRMHPPGKAFPGDERRWEEQNEPADLTDRGRKLLGLDAW
jgi:hypothetical protein